MSIKFPKWFKNGSPIEVSVRSFIAIITAITVCIGASSGKMDFQDFKEIALVVFTYYFTVRTTEERVRRSLRDEKTEEL